MNQRPSKGGNARRVATAEGNIGALVIGGEHPGLGVVRSLGRRGIPVYVLDDQFSVSSFSRYKSRFVRVKDLRESERPSKPCSK